MRHPFLLGAAGYPLLEIISRGRTHYSMALAGGLSCLLIHGVNRLKEPLPVRAVIGGLCVTGVEALCGLIWNRQYQVWDYRGLPLNWRGQICLPYTMLWSLLAWGLMCLDNPPPKMK
ncbi:MAG: hypothetical protein ACI4MJ_10200 [Aristaeellaceae bacterium]